ncbi:hypothetical protein SRHO_G00126360 [Serrasalmus rhombeus]
MKAMKCDDPEETKTSMGLSKPICLAVLKEDNQMEFISILHKKANPSLGPEGPGKPFHKDTPLVDGAKMKQELELDEKHMKENRALKRPL